MSLRSFSLLVVLAVALAGASPVEAQDTAPSEARDAEAHSLFEAGRTAYSESRFEAALGHFTQAYELSGRPQLLYNIGQCRDRLRQDAEAAAAFEAFLAAVPDSPQRTEVTARLEILHASLQRAETTATVIETTDATTVEATSETTTEVPPAPAAADPAPWIVLGVGGAVAIVGAILVGVGYADIATVDGASNVRFETVRGAYEDAPVLTGVGWAALGVGVALAGVGLVWGLTSGGSSGEHARLQLGPSGLSLTGSF